MVVKFDYDQFWIQDEDGDNICEIISDGYYENKPLILYWRWDSDQLSYVLYEQYIWSDETEKYELFTE